VDLNIFSFSSLLLHIQTTGATSYIPSTTVVVAEVYKFLLTLLIVYYRDFEDRLESERINLIINLIATSARASVPAFLYAIQNNLVFIALANLDAATFQVMYQSKIITTAVFSVLILGRKLSVTESISLLFLFQGVILVQSPACPSSEALTSDILVQEEKNVFLGFLVVCAISCTSGFAGVYMEKIMKSGSGSPFARNVQLAFWGLIFSIVMMFYNDYHAIVQKGFFHGYNWAVWGIINISALGGILVAMVVAYTDNIAKGFATSVSIVLSSIISICFFQFSVTRTFFIGASVVILSVLLYTDPDKRWAAQKSQTKV
jgi:UDP-sugar transporter A1/2/3